MAKKIKSSIPNYFENNSINYCEECPYCLVSNIRHYNMFGRFYMVIDWYCENSNTDGNQISKEVYIKIPEWCELEEI